MKSAYTLRFKQQTSSLFLFLFLIGLGTYAQDCPVKNGDGIFNPQTDIIITSYHQSIAKTTTGLVTWGEDMAANGADATSITEITPANGYNYAGTPTHFAVSGNDGGQAFLATTTSLYAWGLSGEVVDGSFVSGSSLNDMNTTENLPFNSADITQMHASSDVLFVVVNGQIWVATDDITAPNGNTSTNANIWQQVQTSAGNPLTDVVEVTGNKYAGYALLENGDLYTWGDNVVLANGTGIQDLDYATQMNALPSSVSITQISAFTHNDNDTGLLVLGSDSKVYGVGDNTLGRIITQNANVVTNWTTIKNFSGNDITNVLQMATSETSEEWSGAAILVAGASPNDPNVIYTWGHNNFDSIGHDSTSIVEYPTIPPSFNTGVDEPAFVSVGGHATTFFNQAGDGSICFVGHIDSGSTAGLSSDGSVFECVVPNNIQLCGAFVDDDNDGVIDTVDLDSDNDGILNIDEGFCNASLTTARREINASPGDDTQTIDLTSLGVSIGDEVIVDNVLADGDLGNIDEVFSLSINGQPALTGLDPDVECIGSLSPLQNPIRQSVSVIDIGGGTPGISLNVEFDGEVDTGVCSGFALAYTVDVRCGSFSRSPRRNINTSPGNDTQDVDLTSLGVSIGDQVIVDNVLADGDMNDDNELFSLSINGGSAFTGLQTEEQCFESLIPLSNPIPPQTVSVIDLGGGTPGITLNVVYNGNIDTGQCSGFALAYTVDIRLTAPDTDDDGTPDYLDLDSDGDNCPDALEGDGGFSLADVDANGELIGGTDANGVPNIANGGQNDVSSTNDSISSGQCDDDGDGVINANDQCSGGDDNLDADNDGIPDACDLDSDNDGIPDAEECNGSTEVFNSTFPTTGGQTNTVPGWTVGGTYAPSGPWSSGGRVHLVSDGLEFRRDASTVSTLTRNISGLTTEASLSLNDVYWVKTQSTGASTLTIRYAGTIYATITTTGNTPSVSAQNGASVSTNSLETIFTNTGLPFQSLKKDVVITLPSTIPASGNVQLRFQASASSTEARDIGLAGVTLNNNTCPDTDGDGTPDYLDLDSDNDGCSDAFESGATSIETANYQFTGADTNNDGLVDAVDANGDGNIDYTLSTDFQDENTVACDCPFASGTDTDGDGVDDICDLDIDNDGITNADEQNQNNPVFIDWAESQLDANFDDNGGSLTTSLGGKPVTVTAEYISGNPGGTNSFKGDSFDYSGAVSSDANVSNNPDLGDVQLSIVQSQNLGAKNRVTFEIEANAYCNLSLFLSDFEYTDFTVYVENASGTRLPTQSWTITSYESDGTTPASNPNPYNVSATEISFGSFSNTQTSNPQNDDMMRILFDEVTLRNATKIIIETERVNTSDNHTDYAEFMLSSTCLTLDTDNNGIPDHLDLDSDGDDCPDAVEGDANYSQDNLNPDGSLDTSIYPVDADGIPDGNPQGVGTAQDASTDNCFCVQPPFTDPPTVFTNIGVSDRDSFASGWPGTIPNGFISIQSESKGFVITRLTTAQIDDLAAVEGMLVYDTDVNCVKLYDGNSWNCIERTCNE